MVNVKCPVCNAPLVFPGLVERSPELLQWHPSFGVGEPGWQAWVTDVLNTLIRERNGRAHE